MQHISVAVKSARFGVGQIAGHLLHPLLCRVLPASVTRRVCSWITDIVRRRTAPGEHLSSQEIRACQDRQMRRDKILPGCVLTPLRSRSDSMTAQHVPDVWSRTLWPRLASAPAIRS